MLCFIFYRKDIDSKLIKIDKTICLCMKNSKHCEDIILKLILMNIYYKNERLFARIKKMTFCDGLPSLFSFFFLRRTTVINAFFPSQKVSTLL